MLKYFFRVKREKFNLNSSTWEIRRSSEKNIMLFDIESLHLLQSYIKSINFPRDEGENQQNMLIFVLGCSTPLTAHTGKNEKVLSLHVSAIKFTR